MGASRNTYSDLAKQAWVSPASLLKDDTGKMVEVVGRIGIVEALSKAVNEDTGVRGSKGNSGVGSIFVIKRQEARSDGGFRFVDDSLLKPVLLSTSSIAAGLGGSNASNTEETTSAEEKAENDDGERNTDCDIDTSLDGVKDSGENTGKEDNDFQWGDTPEIHHDLGRSDDVEDCVNDDTGKSSVGDIEEDGGKGVEGKEHNDGGNDTCKRSSNTSLGLDGSSGEGSSSWVGSKERSKQVGDTDGNELLRRVNGIVVDTTKRLGDGNVLDKHDNDGSRKLGSKCGQDSVVHSGCSSVLETCGLCVRQWPVKLDGLHNLPVGTCFRMLTRGLERW